MSSTFLSYLILKLIVFILFPTTFFCPKYGATNKNYSVNKLSGRQGMRCCGGGNELWINVTQQLTQIVAKATKFR